MMTAFLFCFKDQRELGEGHERHYCREVRGTYLSHTAYLKVKDIYQSYKIGIIYN